jgi:hypothetical protein
MSGWAKGLARYQACGVALAVAIVLGGNRAEGGSTHITWGPDAPERLAQSNLRIYENLVAVRDSHPLQFDHNHPFYAKLLTNTAFMKHEVARWELDEPRFEYWHPFLWRVLDGYLNWSELHPTAPSSPTGAQTITPPPAGGAGSVGTTSGGGTTSGQNGVPEPPAAFLLLTGMTLVFLGARVRAERARRCRLAAAEGSLPAVPLIQ